MSAGACLTCQAVGDIEVHHVAGRCNAPDLTVALCLPCHRRVTRWAESAGILLTEGDREPVDVARAIFVGCLHLLERFLELHPRMSQRTPEQARVTGRLVSAGLDLISDPDREGRWTPDARRTTSDQAWHRHHTPNQDAATELLAFDHLIETIGALIAANDKGSALAVAGRAVREHPQSRMVLDVVTTVGALVIGLSSGSRQARLLSHELDEADSWIAATVGAAILGLIARLSAAQRGQVAA